MYVDTKLKAMCLRFLEEMKKTDGEQNQIYYTVLYFIHSASQLSTLYFNWTNLNVYERFALNTQIKPSLPRSGKIVYPPVIRAFEYWDMVQDAYGAPGFNCNPLKTELSEETDRNIVKTMLIMERIIYQIHKKRDLLKELLSYSDVRIIFGDYKWRIICKNMNKRSSYLTNTKSKRDRSGGRSVDEDYVSDLNGSGDTTWHSDTDLKK